MNSQEYYAPFNYFHLGQKLGHPGDDSVAQVRPAALTSVKVWQRHFGRDNDRSLRAVKLTKKAAVTVAGIGNIRESALIQPDGIRVATVYHGTPGAGSQGAGFTIVSNNSLDCQRLPPPSGSHSIECLIDERIGPIRITRYSDMEQALVFW